MINLPWPFLKKWMPQPVLFDLKFVCGIFFFCCAKDGVFVSAGTKDLVEQVRSLHWELLCCKDFLSVKRMYGRAAILLSPEKRKTYPRQTLSLSHVNI